MLVGRLNGGKVVNIVRLSQKFLQKTNQNRKCFYFFYEKLIFEAVSLQKINTGLIIV